MKKFLFSFMCFLSFTVSMTSQVQHKDAGAKPLIRFACMSDIHNELTMINKSDTSKIWLRKSFLTTLDSLKNLYSLDALVLGGDYSSDVTIPEGNWIHMRNLMHDVTNNAFGNSYERHPVIYVTGNHDYEVANFDNLPKKYNAADYYDFPMKEDIGELPESDCFYETADNGSEKAMRLLAAYHYVINGFDFVVLNCGKYFFKSAWDYRMSDESVAWVNNKLDSIYATDSLKTVFFLSHLPLPDTHGATVGKTLLSTASSTKLLLATLAKHPNIIYIYGHDHSSKSNNSFIDSSLVQRLTFYNSDGTTYFPDEESTTGNSNSEMKISSVGNGKYLGFDSNNLGLISEPDRFVVKESKIVKGTVSAFGDNAPNENNGYIYCGTEGRFSGNKELLKYSSLLMYEVADTSGNIFKGIRTMWPEDGKVYAIVALSSKGGYYALTNKLYSVGSRSQRLIGQAVNETDTLTFNTKDVLWLFTKMHKSSSKHSFMSTFMGSMRYNSFNTNSSPGINDSPVIQSLVVSVYADSIILKMHNFGDTGHIVGNSVTADIKSDIPAFIIHRHVTNSADQVHTSITSVGQNYNLSDNRVYTISGMYVGKIDCIPNLSAGIYIFNHKKLVIR